MIFGSERHGLAVASALVAYAVVAGVIGVAQRATSRREQRVQRWNAVFRGGEASERARRAA
jgi:hypothetical protein